MINILSAASHNWSNWRLRHLLLMMGLTAAFEDKLQRFTKANNAANC